MGFPILNNDGSITLSANDAELFNNFAEDLRENIGESDGKLKKNLLICNFSPKEDIGFTYDFFRSYENALEEMDDLISASSLPAKKCHVFKSGYPIANLWKR